MFRRRVNNFGDLLGPLVVEEIVRRESLRPTATDHRLLAVGSILYLARNNDVVWGAGVNGKSISKPFTATALDVRAVRGPLTRDFLVGQGIHVPETYGDPGLLVGPLFGRDRLRGDRQRRPLTIVPNLNDVSAGDRTNAATVLPTAPLAEVLGAIAASDFVVGSSLHAIVVAESLGIPARLVRSKAEPTFKYEDYYLGSGRESFTFAESVDEAIEMGGEKEPSWSPDALMAAFPRDLWTLPQTT